MTSKFRNRIHFDKKYYEVVILPAVVTEIICLGGWGQLGLALGVILLGILSRYGILLRPQPPSMLTTAGTVNTSKKTFEYDHKERRLYLL